MHLQTRKPNILITGPSFSGKTYFANAFKQMNFSASHDLAKMKVLDLDEIGAWFRPLEDGKSDLHRPVWLVSPKALVPKLNDFSIFVGVSNNIRFLVPFFDIVITIRPSLAKLVTPSFIDELIKDRENPYNPLSNGIEAYTREAGWLQDELSYANQAVVANNFDGSFLKAMFRQIGVSLTNWKRKRSPYGSSTTIFATGLDSFASGILTEDYPNLPFEQTTFETVQPELEALVSQKAESSKSFSPLLKAAEPGEGKEEPKKPAAKKKKPKAEAKPKD